MLSSGCSLKTVDIQLTPLEFSLSLSLFHVTFVNKDLRETILPAVTNEPSPM